MRSADNLCDIYVNAVHKTLKRYAAWLPGIAVDIGDIGSLIGRRFEPKGNVLKDKRFARMTFGQKHSRAKATYEVLSGVQKMERLDLAPSASCFAGGRLAISFSVKDAFLLHAADCIQTHMTDSHKLELRLKKLYATGHLEKDFAIVTGTFVAGATTIIAATAKGASIELDLDAGPSAVGSCLGMSGRISTYRASHIGLSILAKEGIVPFFELSRVGPKTFMERFTGNSTLHTAGFGSEFVEASLHNDDTMDEDIADLELVEIP